MIGYTIVNVVTKQGCSGEMVQERLGSRTRERALILRASEEGRVTLGLDLNGMLI